MNFALQDDACANFEGLEIKRVHPAKLHELSDFFQVLRSRATNLISNARLPPAAFGSVLSEWVHGDSDFIPSSFC